MNQELRSQLDWIESSERGARAVEKVGAVVRVTGLIIESEGPEASIGQICRISSTRNKDAVDAEVVGFRDNLTLLMALESVHHIHPGCKVTAAGETNQVPTGNALLGRVIDGMGRPLDDKGPLKAPTRDGYHAAPPNPLDRRVIKTPFRTGIKSIDTFVPMGRGQRMGVFSGSGVGKSIMLGMTARGSEADVNVIVLVGERGRELREFVENDLGPDGLAKSVVVVSTADQTAPMRIRAAYLATALAEGFRNEGKNVLFLLDSLTRVAMAQREIGLAVGEPPASRGYTPSVFSMLPRLLERTGTSDLGAITSIYTVLVEGDDMNEPVADAVRGFLDGHVVLSRRLANANHYPAVDVLRSVSRVARAVCAGVEMELISEARDLLAVYQHNEDLINVGAYVPKTNPRIDLAIEKQPGIESFLKQRYDSLFTRDEAFGELRSIFS